MLELSLISCLVASILLETSASYALGQEQDYLICAGVMSLICVVTVVIYLLLREFNGLCMGFDHFFEESQRIILGFSLIVFFITFFFVKEEEEKPLEKPLLEKTDSPQEGDNV